MRRSTWDAVEAIFEALLDVALYGSVCFIAFFGFMVIALFRQFGGMGEVLSFAALCGLLVWPIHIVDHWYRLWDQWQPARTRERDAVSGSGGFTR